MIFFWQWQLVCFVYYLNFSLVEVDYIIRQSPKFLKSSKLNTRHYYFTRVYEEFLYSECEIKLCTWMLIKYVFHAKRTAKQNKICLDHSAGFFSLFTLLNRLLHSLMSKHTPGASNPLNTVFYLPLCTSNTYTKLSVSKDTNHYKMSAVNEKISNRRLWLTSIS